MTAGSWIFLVGFAVMTGANVILSRCLYVSRKGYREMLDLCRYWRRQTEIARRDARSTPFGVSDRI